MADPKENAHNKDDESREDEAEAAQEVADAKSSQAEAAQDYADELKKETED